MLDWETILENLKNHRNETKIIHFATIDNEELFQYFIIATIQIWGFEKMDEGTHLEGIENNEGNYLELANNAKYYHELQQEMGKIIETLKINDKKQLFDKCKDSYEEYVINK
jgi:hypothetical protein